MKKFIFTILVLFILPMIVYADEATDISKQLMYSENGTVITRINDDNIKTSYKLSSGSKILINSESNNIKQLYIVYEISSQRGKLISNNNEEVILGANGFLHEYVNLNTSSNEVTLSYDTDVIINEIDVFTEGETPSHVQKWVKEDTTDLMIFSTHADDEQLFFAGVMPTYINKGKKVHVVYLARHDVGSYYAPNRLHEQLDGLWTLGVTDYPTFGLIPDAYSESINVARSQMNASGFTDDDIIKFNVEQIRFYKPKVILGHDENGEYGHGQHILNITTLKDSIAKAADQSYTQVSLDAYSVPKFYIHLYDLENKTELDYDIPLEKYGNKTAYQVSKEGYSKHLSQQYTWFTKWLNGNNNEYTSSKQITKYNPAYWGLYKSDVGPDINKNDLFENISEETVVEDNTDLNTIIEDTKQIKESLDDLYNKYKDLVIIVSGLVVIVGMILIVIIKRAELK